MRLRSASVKVIAGIIVVALATAAGGSAPQPRLAGCAVFPADSPWNTRVDSLPIAPNSDAIIASIGAGVGLHPDFGSGKWAGGPIGIPYNVVNGATLKKWTKVKFQYADESDPGPYPIPKKFSIEHGSDRHALIVDSSTCKLYELFALKGKRAGSGAIWDLRSNALRPDGWTSADAAGLPILPGLARYDEVAAGVIAHALRFTVPSTQDAHIYPARHDAGDGPSASLPPMGLRLRLKASVDISGYGPQSRVILTALKRYGMILADNGSAYYVSGAPDPRWDDDDLHDLHGITGSMFEVVNTSGFVNG